MLRAIILVSFGVLLSACASTGHVPITEARSVAYDADRAAVREAFRLTFQERGWTAESGDDDFLSARAHGARDNARFGVRFADADTLSTIARLSATYRPYHEASSERFLTLLDRVEEHLAGIEAYRYPLLVYPRGRSTCDGPGHAETAGLTFPELHGGLRSVMERVRYPDEARAAGIEGIVFVQFVVDEEGRIECAMIDRGLPGGLNEAAIHALLPATFDPARVNGEPVPIRMALPVTFRLR